MADSEGGTQLASPIDGGGTPHSPTHPTDGLPLIRQHLRDRGISQADVCRSYERNRQKDGWWFHCGRPNCGTLVKEPRLITKMKNVLTLPLTTEDHPIMRHTKGVGYDCVTTARGALSLLGLVATTPWSTDCLEVYST
ncbi:uncharacterized protein LOC135104944 [Scylla paramamosain]|uniref:uncharacterized protein LOC135104944 n=1 Tax=Scylla paramamosain TaxID=85552 RepID=UPI0030834BD7